MKRLIFLGFLLCAGCASIPQTTFYQLNEKGTVDQKTISRALWENELPSTQNSVQTLLLENDYSSYYLVQIRGTEDRYRHVDHDLALFFQSGIGILFLGKENNPIRVGTGSVVFVPHNTPYYFMNTGPTAGVFLAVYTPPYNGKDKVLVKEK